MEWGEGVFRSKTAKEKGRRPGEGRFKSALLAIEEWSWKEKRRRYWARRPKDKEKAPNHQSTRWPFEHERKNKIAEMKKNEKREREIEKESVRVQVR